MLAKGISIRRHNEGLMIVAVMPSAQSILAILYLCRLTGDLECKQPAKQLMRMSFGLCKKKLSAPITLLHNFIHKIT